MSRQKNRDATQDVAIKNNTDAIKIIAQNEKEQSDSIRKEADINAAQEKELSAQKDLNDKQTLNIVRNAEEIAYNKKTMVENDAKLQKKNDDQDRDLILVEENFKMAIHDLRKSISWKVILGYVIAISALVIALVK